MPVGRDQVAAMRRLVRLMAVLDQAGSVGATRDQLIAVADYGTADPGSQLAVDLRHLRRQGWQIDNVSGAGETARYRMVTGDNRLRVRLQPAESAALQRAVLLADRADLAAGLGVSADRIPVGIGTQAVPRADTADLTRALQAVRFGCRIRFTYKGSPRVVDPASVRFQNHHWYLSGCEVGSDMIKHFVVGRMSGAGLDKPGTADPVAGVDTPRLTLHPLAWAVDPPVTVVLRVPGDFVPDVERWLRAPDVARAVGGSVEMTYTVVNRAAFRARLYQLGTRVSVVGPAAFRAEIVAELRSLAGVS